MKTESISFDSGADVGAMLREWRLVRRLSQLDLALQADVSARHLSYVETGRSKPSREMIVRLAESLAVPLRERNALFIAGGFAPKYPESGLDTPRLAQMRYAVEAILAQQEPYPAYLCNRHWDILMQNEAAGRLNRCMLDGRDSPHTNMLHQFFDPADLRGAVENWEEIAGSLLRYLHNEVAASRADTKAAGLLDDMLAYPGVPAHWRHRELGTAPAPVLTTRFKRDGARLAFFSTITTFGTPRDVTLDEVFIESCFPADAETAAFCRRLQADGG
ncbi:helix-turn-helix domain-containing protein [Pseudoduganella umbonata]|uniref:Helix-turn-helix transcriptional regulator n=1 Tax=Pseudoduganella umbonata TaxID=864828 RepID=A0A4P8HRB2_9BURK|nr:helix-turn-helix transcriptional regulator [Pseudoduganella umbonata]MBB3220817.1 transcriptional regulator with XRE-family HTH domain [Pseudoduganella umbonata]QCP11716.1 helix-turn-helix transcriptional regulator [Pseudoduganella umbonata]